MGNFALSKSGKELDTERAAWFAVAAAAPAHPHLTGINGVAAAVNRCGRLGLNQISGWALGTALDQKYILIKYIFKTYLVNPTVKILNFPKLHPRQPYLPESGRYGEAND